MAVVAALTLGAAGCSGGGDSGESSGKGSGKGKEGASASSAKPMLSEAEANKILDSYEKANNAANAKQDKAAARKIQAGALAEASVQDYAQFPYFSAKYKKEYMTPWFQVNREFFIPSDGDWFMAFARNKTNGKKRPYIGAMVFERQGDGAWKKVAHASMDAKEGVPDLLKNKSGSAEVVGAGAAGLGGTKLTQLDDAVNSFWGATNVAGDGPTLETTRSTKYISKYVRDQEKRLECIESERKAVKNPYPKVYALKTRDGGAFAVFNSKLRSTFTAPDLQCYVNPGSDELVYLNGKKKLGAYWSEQLETNAAEVQKDGKVLLWGYRWSTVNAKEIPGYR